MPLAPNTRLGPYSIVSLIGSGGMGDVYRGWDTRLERDVAVKLLKEELSIDDRALLRFKTEARAIAASAHPNILAIYDAELEHPPLFLVTELLHGETLRPVIERSPLPWRRAVDIAASVADGLAAAHETGIIHRDLKPENIFLTSRGIVKILDFGLAQFKFGKRGEPDPLTSTVSAVNLITGTVGYMAPEQVRGETLTAATDVFSLACVIYEMVSGRRAFQRSTPASTLIAILNDEPRGVQEYDQTIPPELNRWIGRCLEKDPSRRPQSAVDLALILRDLAGEKTAGRRPSERGSDAEIESIAVLPFFTSSNSPDAEYLADGITESLINTFAQLSGLRVVARSTVFRHKGKDVDPIQVGRDLSVQVVLTGRIFQRGEILVIGAELVSVRDGSHLWGQQYKRQLTDIFAIEDELSREISGRLRVHFTAQEQARMARRYTEDAKAYQLYLRGRHAWNKRTIDGMRQARNYFDQAIEADPSYARAYTGLADCLQMLGIYGDMDSRPARIRAKAAQEMALQIDDALGEAYASSGFGLLLFDWRFPEAEEALRRAVKLNVGYASAHQWLGFVLGMTGRVDEARKSLKIAQELDPFSASINTSAVWPLYWARRGAEAVEGFRAAVELHPGYWVAHYYLALAYSIQGDWGNAVLSARQAHELGDSAWKFAGAGFVYARAGRHEEAREILAKLDEASHVQYTAPFYSAVVHAGLGNTDEALTLLGRAVNERNWNIAWLGVDLFWDEMRSDARFQQLLAETIGVSPFD